MKFFDRLFGRRPPAYSGTTIIPCRCGTRFRDGANYCHACGQSKAPPSLIHADCWGGGGAGKPTMTNRARGGYGVIVRSGGTGAAGYVRLYSPVR